MFSFLFTLSITNTNIYKTFWLVLLIALKKNLNVNRILPTCIDYNQSSLITFDLYDPKSFRDAFILIISTSA